jgi:hypothetical protein
MTNSKDGMEKEHTGAGVFHHFDYSFSHIRQITMNEAFRARAYLFAIRASGKTDFNIFK